MAIITQIHHLGKSDVIVVYDDVAKEMLKVGAVNRSKNQNIRIKIRSPITLEEIVSKETTFDGNLPSKLPYTTEERELEGGEIVTEYHGIHWHTTLGN